MIGTDVQTPIEQRLTWVEGVRSDVIAAGPEGAVKQPPQYEVCALWGITQGRWDGYVQIYSGNDDERFVDKISFWVERCKVRAVSRTTETDPLKFALLRLDALERGYTARLNENLYRFDRWVDYRYTDLRMLRMQLAHARTEETP